MPRPPCAPDAHDFGFWMFTFSEGEHMEGPKHGEKAYQRVSSLHRKCIRCGEVEYAKRCKRTCRTATNCGS